MEKKFIFLQNVLDLSEHQRSSYYGFLLNGIAEEFRELENPGTAYFSSLTDFHIDLFFPCPAPDPHEFPIFLKLLLTKRIPEEAAAKSSKYLIRKLNKLVKPLFTDVYSDDAAFLKATIYRNLDFDEIWNEELKTYVPVIRPEKKIDPILAEATFFPSTLVIEGPELNYLKSLRQNKTYGIQVYVPTCYSWPFKIEQDMLFYLKNKDVENFSTVSKFSSLYDYIAIIINSRLKKYFTDIVPSIPFGTIINQNSFLGELPFITTEGTFLVAGCERVVVSQIIKSPGVYFQKAFSERAGVYYIASIISTVGNWTRFTLMTPEQLEFEEEAWDEDLYFYLKNTQSIHAKKIVYDFGLPSLVPNNDLIFLEFFNADALGIGNDCQRIFLYDFLRWFGISKKEIRDSLKYPNNFDYEDPFHEAEAKLSMVEDITEDLFDFFYEGRNGCFSIGKNARFRLNEKFGHRLPLNVSYLTILDFLSIIDGLIELKYYDGISDDIDHLKNKQIRSVGELLQLQLRIVLQKVQLRTEVSRGGDEDYIYFQLEDFFSEKKPTNDLILNTVAAKRSFISNIAEYVIQYGLLQQYQEKINKNKTFKKFRDFYSNRSDIINQVTPNSYLYKNLIEVVRTLPKSSNIFHEILKLKKKLKNYEEKGILKQKKISKSKIFRNYIQGGLNKNTLLNKKIKFPYRIQYIEFLKLQKKEIIKLLKWLPDSFFENNPYFPNFKKVLGKEIEEYYLHLPYLDSVDPLKLDYRYFTRLLKKFFQTSPLSQFLDQVNPLSEMAHKRKISSFGPNGLQRDHVSIKIRDIHPSQYGRLCPIETPEGQNAGLVSSLSLFGRINKYGYLETPYFTFQEGKYKENYPGLYLNSEQETKLEVGYSDVSLDLTKKTFSEYLSIKQNYSFLLKKTKEVNFLLISPLQILSLSANLIPFIEHDDGNRALMGSNMQRQAVPLLRAQKPIVGTGLESIAIRDSKMVLKACTESMVIKTSSTFLELKDNANQKLLYRLVRYKKSNQETGMVQRSIVWPGEKVYAGQIIADGPGSLDGELSLGRNLLMAYMPWEGYNFEDAIIINEDLLIKDALTSIHIQEVDILFTNGYIVRDYFTRKKCAGSKYQKRNLGSYGVAYMGSYVRKRDIIVGKVYYPRLSKYTYLEKLKKNVFDILGARPIIPSYTKNFYRDCSLKIKEHQEGRVIDIRFVTPKIDPAILEISPKLLIKVSIAQIRKVEVGDKLSGRHGNKGVISKILPRQDMPYLPDGRPLDILFNPLGVPSRMNIGQLFECILGFAGENLGKRFKITPFDEIYGNEASRILVTKKIIEAACLSKKKWLYNPNFEGKVLLRDGRTGEYFDNPITIGRGYILKLIHLVEDKIHGRAMGPYSFITEQPSAGKSRHGGQRFGEMEVWALEAHGCSYTLQELLTVKSDDIDSRQDLNFSLLDESKSEKPVPSISECLLVLIRELNALGFDFEFFTLNSEKKGTMEFEKTPFEIFSLLQQRLKLRPYLAQQDLEINTNKDIIIKSIKDFFEQRKPKKKKEVKSKKKPTKKKKLTQKKKKKKEN